MGFGLPDKFKTHILNDLLQKPMLLLIFSQIFFSSPSPFVSQSLSLPISQSPILLSLGPSDRHALSLARSARVIHCSHRILNTFSQSPYLLFSKSLRPFISSSLRLPLSPSPILLSLGPSDRHLLAPLSSFDFSFSPFLRFSSSPILPISQSAVIGPFGPSFIVIGSLRSRHLTFPFLLFSASLLLPFSQSPNPHFSHSPILPFSQSPHPLISQSPLLRFPHSHLPASKAFTAFTASTAFSSLH